MNESAASLERAEMHLTMARERMDELAAKSPQVELRVPISEFDTSRDDGQDDEDASYFDGLY